MISFINTFLSYLLVMIVFFVLIVLAVISGKKLREKKDLKDALMAENTSDESIKFTVTKKQPY